MIGMYQSAVILVDIFLLIQGVFPSELNKKGSVNSPGYEPPRKRDDFYFKEENAPQSQQTQHKSNSKSYYNSAGAKVKNETFSRWTLNELTMFVLSLMSDYKEYKEKAEKWMANLNFAQSNKNKNNKQEGIQKKSSASLNNNRERSPRNRMQQNVENKENPKPEPENQFKDKTTGKRNTNEKSNVKMSDGISSHHQTHDKNSQKRKGQKPYDKNRAAEEQGIQKKPSASINEDNGESSRKGRRSINNEEDSKTAFQNPSKDKKTLGKKTMHENFNVKQSEAVSSHQISTRKAEKLQGQKNFEIHSDGRKSVDKNENSSEEEEECICDDLDEESPDEGPDEESQGAQGRENLSTFVENKSKKEERNHHEEYDDEECSCEELESEYSDYLKHSDEFRTKGKDPESQIEKPGGFETILDYIYEHSNDSVLLLFKEEAKIISK